MSLEETLSLMKEEVNDFIEKELPEILAVLIENIDHFLDEDKWLKTDSVEISKKRLDNMKRCAEAIERKGSALNFNITKFIEKYIIEEYKKLLLFPSK